MVYQFVVTLRNENSKYIDILSLLLCSFSALFFLREQVLVTLSRTIIYLTGFIFILIVVAWNLYQLKTKKKEKVYYNRALFFAALVWANMPYMQWLVFVFAALGLIERQAKFPLEIGFSDKQVVFNSLLKRKFEWTAFNNVVLKDNLLTVDFKNNTVFQKETIDDDGDAEEEEFNIYCQEQLSKSNRFS